MKSKASSSIDRREQKTETFNVADLLKIQSGAIVSRTLVDKQCGSITLFAFDEGEGLSEHTAPYDAAVHILSGTAEIVISGKPFTVRGGEMIIMAAGKPHSLKALERFKMMLIMIRSEK
jgi:quercetin dioxygenase-like cupin family protein